MRIKLHDDVEGHKAGESIDVTKARGEWLLVNGYASAEDYDDDKNPSTGVPASKDQTDPKVTKQEPLPNLREQMADGLGKPDKVDPDPVLHFVPGTHEPIELTNGKGKPKAAEDGKDDLEEEAASSDPEGAPENDPKVVQQRQKAADKVEADTPKA